MSSNSFAYWLFHAITFERKVFSKIHESKSKKSLRETREYRCLLVSTDAEAARAGTDGYTDTQDDYSNPRACSPRVNKAIPTRTTSFSKEKGAALGGTRTLAHARRGLTKQYQPGQLLFQRKKELPWVRLEPTTLFFLDRVLSLLSYQGSSASRALSLQYNTTQDKVKPQYSVLWHR